MAPVWKLAIATCALGAPATAGSQDAAGLLQSDVKLHGPDDVMLARAHTSAAARKFTKSLMFSILGNGRRWSKLLYGNETVAAIPAPTAPSGAGIGCSPADRESVMTSVTSIVDSVQDKLQEQLPKIMAGHMLSDHDGDASPFLPSASGPMALPIDIGDLADLPEACQPFLKDPNLEWQMVASCIHDGLKASDSCVQCFPTFGAGLQQKCQAACEKGLNDAQDKLMEGQRDMQEQMEKMMKSGGAGGLPGMPAMPDMQAMQSIAQVLTGKLNDAVQTALPCGECVAPEATEFAGCVMGEAGKAEASSLFDSLIASVKNGDLLKVQVAGPGAMEEGGQAQMPMPM